MNCPGPSWATVQPSERLADTPAVRRGERWWLTAPGGTIPADDPALTHELDLLAADMDAANRAVAQLMRGEPDQGLG
ncbi:hypothetical protein [Streptomyces iranensis]|uniref:Uncharacterized protein n=1 Tax=Streptomyces iranensis TaxID=576784 RepID=A0A061A4V9_9ACTN|nr:hypothetical protein [Streptomyces iranensis]MBP2059572.1 hypothetical protein [Streptomyces iranensis]CDR10536.1 predicted protein [Streptomyces iranensis]